MTTLDEREREHIEAIIALVEAEAGKIEVVNELIIITWPGTSFRVVYHKPTTEPGLVAAEIVRDPRAKTLADETVFLAGAWRMANKKARELGWIV